LIFCLFRGAGRSIKSRVLYIDYVKIDLINPVRNFYLRGLLQTTGVLIFYKIKFYLN